MQDNAGKGEKMKTVVDLMDWKATFVCGGVILVGKKEEEKYYIAVSRWYCKQGKE